MGRKKDPLAENHVLRVLSEVWGQTNRAIGHSWERLNGAMRAALRLVISAGFEFQGCEFAAIRDRWSPGYWLDIERAYTWAVAADNLSAAKAIEAYLGRRPLIADDVTHNHYAVMFHHSGDFRKRDRLAVGSWFHWNGEQVKVTSFPDGESCIACSYRPRGDNEDGDKIKRRYRITQSMILDDRKRRREAKAKQKTTETKGKAE